MRQTFFRLGGRYLLPALLLAAGWGLWVVRVPSVPNAPVVMPAGARQMAVDREGTVLLRLGLNLWRLRGGKMRRIATAPSGGTFLQVFTGAAGEIYVVVGAFRPPFGGTLYRLEEGSRLVKVRDLQSPQAKGYSELNRLTWTAEGDVYEADSSGNRVLRHGSNGTTRVFAGTGAPRCSGDGGPAVKAEVNEPCLVVVGPDGSVYILADWGECVRKVDADGIITTVMGDHGGAHSRPFWPIVLDWRGTLFGGGGITCTSGARTVVILRDADGTAHYYHWPSSEWDHWGGGRCGPGQFAFDGANRLCALCDHQLVCWDRPDRPVTLARIARFW